MKIDLTPFEQKVLILRRKGYTFGQIANELGVKNTSQVQERYSRTLRKMRVLKDLQKYDKALIKSAENAGFSFSQLSRLYSILRDNRILAHYKRMSDEELLDIYGIGAKYLEVLKNARE